MYLFASMSVTVELSLLCNCKCSMVHLIYCNKIKMTKWRSDVYAYSMPIKYNKILSETLVYIRFGSRIFEGVAHAGTGGEVYVTPEDEVF